MTEDQALLTAYDCYPDGEWAVATPIDGGWLVCQTYDPAQGARDLCLIVGRCAWRYRPVGSETKIIR